MIYFLAKGKAFSKRVASTKIRGEVK